MECAGHAAVGDESRFVAGRGWGHSRDGCAAEPSCGATGQLAAAWGRGALPRGRGGLVRWVGAWRN